MIFSINYCIRIIYMYIYIIFWYLMCNTHTVGSNDFFFVYKGEYNTQQITHSIYMCTFYVVF